jgi:hypothetical protein
MESDEPIVGTIDERIRNLVMDECLVRYDDKYGLKKGMRGIGIGLGAVTQDGKRKKSELVMWRGLISYNNGDKGDWNVLLSLFLGDVAALNIYGRELHLCNFLYDIITDFLSHDKTRERVMMDGFSEDTIEKRLDYILGHSHKTEKGTPYKGVKQKIGRIVRKKMENIERDLIEMAEAERCLYDAISHTRLDYL